MFVLATFILLALELTNTIDIGWKVVLPLLGSLAFMPIRFWMAGRTFRALQKIAAEDLEGRGGRR